MSCLIVYTSKLLDNHLTEIIRSKIIRPTIQASELLASDRGRENLENR